MSLLDFNKLRARKLHNQAMALQDEGRDDEAIQLYSKAIVLNPRRSASHYNIGLIYKYRGDWQRSLEYNQAAYDLAPDDEAARWNLAIAATALRRWDIARSAWVDNGIEIDGDDGPIDQDFGWTPVRLNPDDSGEVVWASRIDPVRARIENIPFRESGFHYRDIVLHDGAETGYRESAGQRYPVFNVLELFERSGYETATAIVDMESDQDIQLLETLFEPTPHYFEDWTASVRTLCRQCSEGTPHEQHDRALEETPLPNRRTLGIATLDVDEAHALLEQWQARCGAVLQSLDR